MKHKPPGWLLGLFLVAVTLFVCAGFLIAAGHKGLALGWITAAAAVIGGTSQYHVTRSVGRQVTWQSVALRCAYDAIVTSAIAALFLYVV